MRTRGLGAAIVAAGLSACVDGTGPTGVDLVEEVPIQASASFASVPTDAEVFELRRARLAVVDTARDTVLVVSSTDLDPSDDRWMFQIRVVVPYGRTIPVKLRVELASLDSLDVEVVRWSGETEAFDVGAGLELLVIREVRPVTLYRGPADNLSSISIALDAPPELTFGQIARLTSSIEGGGPGKVAFYESLDPEVAAVDPSSGLFVPLDVGTVRVVAHAGPSADTATVSIRPPSVLADAETIAELAREVDYFGSPAFVQGMQDLESVADIGVSLRGLGLALASSNVMESARRFIAAARALDGYAEGSERIRREDSPQLSYIHYSLIIVGDALGIPFGREGGEL